MPGRTDLGTFRQYANNIIVSPIDQATGAKQMALLWLMEGEKMEFLFIARIMQDQL